MSAYKNQHFVPKFILRRFSEDKASIRLFNIDKTLTIDSASIAGQCAKLNFYSKTPEIENALEVLDAESASITHSIITNRTLPKEGSYERMMLNLFFVLQSFRTESVADDLNSHHDHLIKHAYSEKIKREAGITEKDLEEIQIGIENAAARAVAIGLSGHYLTLDLSVKLLINETNLEFITSDHPVILYNQYLEHRRLGSNTGLQSLGLQGYLALDPRHMLMFYDSSVYKIGSKKQTDVVSISMISDVSELNRAAYLNAVRNIYYKSQVTSGWINECHYKNKNTRRKERTAFQVVAKKKTTAGREEIVQFSANDLRVGLKPSIITIRKPARVKLREIESQAMQPAVLIRNAEMTRAFESFRKLVRQGRYRSSEFLKYIRDLAKMTGSER